MAFSKKMAVVGLFVLVVSAVVSAEAGTELLRRAGLAELVSRLTAYGVVAGIGLGVFTGVWCFLARERNLELRIARAEARPVTDDRDGNGIPGLIRFCHRCGTVLGLAPADGDPRTYVCVACGDRVPLAILQQQSGLIDCPCCGGTGADPTQQGVPCPAGCRRGKVRCTEVSARCVPSDFPREADDGRCAICGGIGCDACGNTGGY